MRVRTCSIQNSFSTWEEDKWDAMLYFSQDAFKELRTPGPIRDVVYTIYTGGYKIDEVLQRKKAPRRVPSISKTR